MQANDVKEAYENTVHVMKDSMGEYSIPAVSESPIVDVFPYFSGDEDETERLEEFTRLKDSVPFDNQPDEELETADSLVTENE